MRLQRWNWHPAPTPSDAVVVGFHDAIAGDCRLTIQPARAEGRPGERIPVRVTLTNTDSKTSSSPSVSPSA